MSIDFYAVSNNPDTDSMAAGRTEKKSVFNKREINDGKATAWGWKTFIKSIETSSYGIVKTINIATELTDKELDSCCNYMECLTNNNIDGIFRLYFSSEVEVGAAVDEFRVFSFTMDVDVRPLTSISPEEKKRNALKLYKEIVKIISDYRKSNMFINGQMPLNCICEDNIYLSTKKDRVHIKILPMVNKKKMNERDINIDLYDAAYLYFKLRYPDNEQFEGDETEQFIERSLSPFKSRQPSLEDIENYFEISASGDNGQEEGHISDTNKDDDPKPNEYIFEEHDRKGSNDNVRSIVSSAFSKVKGFILGKVSEMNNGIGEDDGTIEK